MPLFTERESFLIRESFRSGTFYPSGTDVSVWLNEQVADNGGTVEQFFAHEAGTDKNILEFQARVAELEDSLQMFLSRVPEHEFCDADYAEAHDRYHRTPAQSLAHIKEQTLREAARKFINKNYDYPGYLMSPEEVQKWFEAEADRMKPEAEDG